MLALVVVPVAVVGLPDAAVLGLGRDRGSSGSKRWRNGPGRSSGVLTVGVGLEQALVATLRSTPAPIAPEVTRLVARLRARWVTEDALRAFADELDDSTGDLVAANLILGARRRGAGLASVLEGLAESVAADVRARRQVEADRAKPRATARWVTLISVGGAGDPRGVGHLRRAVPEPARAGHPRRPARGVRRHAGLDEAHGDGPGAAPIPAHVRTRGRRSMTTGLQLALAGRGAPRRSASCSWSPA